MKSKFVCLILFCFSFLYASDDWDRVYLATFPRSGNHWVRYLIEEATHVATGSVYCDRDPPHLPNPFPWGGYSAPGGYGGKCRYPTKADIVVIKTHFPVFGTQFDGLSHRKVIHIIRHPVDSFYSFFCYEKQPPLPKIVPRGAVMAYILAWRNFQNYWLSQDEVFTVRYEDLLDNPKEVFADILENIGYQLSNNDIVRAVNKHPPQGYVLKHVENFSKSDLRLINDELKDLMNRFNYQIPNLDLLDQ